MLILAIESSCDETAAAIIKDSTQILAEVTATSMDVHKKYGGIVPEVSARMQAEYIIPVLTEVMQKVEITKDDIDAIAVTYGPGLMGPLLVGVETAKTIAYVWQKPLIPVNHLIGHIYSAWLDEKQPPQFPALAAIVSGGHTELLLMKGHDEFERIGSTRDDAVGEAFDKVARALDLPYPGGPEIEKAALQGDPMAFDLPRPMLDSPNLDFSFSGLKTAIMYKLREIGEETGKKETNNIAASFQQAVSDVLVHKILKAIKIHDVRSVLFTGGVSANKTLRNAIEQALIQSHPDITFHCPPIALATDNATYIGAAASFNKEDWQLDPTKPDELEKIFELAPNPNLKIGN